MVTSQIWLEHGHFSNFGGTGLIFEKELD